MIFLEAMSFKEALVGGMMGGAVVAAIIALGIIALILGIAIYVYFALALMTIAKKLKHKHAWLAWIPFANLALVLQLGKFHWAWVFLMLIPVVGWVALGIMSIISFWRIYEKRKYPGALSLILIGVFIPAISAIAMIAHMVVMGIVAWSKK